MGGGFEVRTAFVLLVVGPLRIDRTGGRLRVMLNRDLAMAGGVALCVPVRRDGLSARFAVMVGCGPIVSLFLGVASLGMAVWMPGAAVHLKLGAGMLGLLSIGLGLITLLPMPMGEMALDGLRVLRLLRGGEAAGRDAALLMVSYGRGPGDAGRSPARLGPRGGAGLAGTRGWNIGGSHGPVLRAHARP